VLCTLTISQNQAMTKILPTISTAHSTSSSQRQLTLLHELLVVLCTLTVSTPGTSMALSQWTQFLSQDAKDIWDKLPDEAKDILELESVKMLD
jgi:hypothetical protein